MATPIVAKVSLVDYDENSDEEEESMETENAVSSSDRDSIPLGDRDTPPLSDVDRDTPPMPDEGPISPIHRHFDEHNEKTPVLKKYNEYKARTVQRPTVSKDIPELSSSDVLKSSEEEYKASSNGKNGEISSLTEDVADSTEAANSNVNGSTVAPSDSKAVEAPSKEVSPFCELQVSSEPEASELPSSSDAKEVSSPSEGKEAVSSTPKDKEVPLTYAQVVSRKRDHSQVDSTTSDEVGLV